MSRSLPGKEVGEGILSRGKARAKHAGVRKAGYEKL